MIAFAATLALIVFWWAVGYAVIALTRPRGRVMANILLAPTVGVAATILPAFLASRLGFSAGQFARPMLVSLAIFTAIVLVWRKPLCPPGRTLPFALALGFGLLLNAWPMFQFGFDWLSYASDDMANYVLGALRLANSGFYSVPNVQALSNGSDYSQYYWFLQVPGEVRPGSELMLATLTSATGLSGFQIYMPVVLALHVSLISSAGALVYRGRAFGKAALLVCVLVAMSALATLGVIYQLIGQVGGLSLLEAAAVLLLDEHSMGRAWRSQVRSGLLLGLVAAALLLWYPELVPFLGLGAILYWGAAAVRRRLRLTAVLVQCGTAGATSLVILGPYSLTIALFMLRQIQNGQRPTDLTLPIFPYFLVPSGLADLWGFQTIVSRLPDEPWLSTSIAFGALALAVIVISSVVLTWRGHPCAAITAGMALLAAQLCTQRIDFGLFKLAMFSQSFMLAVVATLAVGGIRRWKWQVAWRPLIPLAVAAIGASGQLVYVQHGRGSDQTAQVPNASSSHLLSELQGELDVSSARLVSDTANVVVAKIESSFTRGNGLNLRSRDFFGNIASYADNATFDPDLLDYGRNVRQQVYDRVKQASFPVLQRDGTQISDVFQVNELGLTQNETTCDLVSSTHSQDILNGRARLPADSGNFVTQPCDTVSNHLIFVDSQLGQHFPLSDPHRTTIFQLEPDLLLPNRTMSGVGRYLLFEIFNPTPTLRIALDITATLKADGQNQLPPAAVVGTERIPFDIPGRGAAQIFSPPVKPLVIDGRSYVMLDMGVDGTLFQQSRNGLMSLYGQSVPLDSRPLVAFARDVSAVSENEYAALHAPSELTSFPTDLLNPDLEYSGVYEDGWVSDDADFYLSQPPTDKAFVHVAGVVPSIDDAYATQLSVYVDGALVGAQALTTGPFDVQLPVEAQPSQRSKIELRFAGVQQLPAPDNRPAAAHLSVVGFETGQPQQGEPNDVNADSPMLQLGANWYPLEQFDGAAFRWVANDAEIRLAPGNPGPRQLLLEVEPGPAGQLPLTLRAFDGRDDQIADFELQGRQTIAIPIDSGAAGSDIVRLHADGPLSPITTDPRILTFRVFSVREE